LGLTTHLPLRPGDPRAWGTSVLLNKE
jgi:hypothetical protein